MALLSSSAAIVPALSGVLANSCLLPAAQHGLRIFTRSASFQSLTAPCPSRDQQPSPSTSMGNQDTAISTAFTWTFAPLARELTRTAGGFERAARWPLGPNSGSLLDAHINGSKPGSLGSSSYSSSHLYLSASYARHYSVVPHSNQQVPQQQCHEHTAAGTIELPEQLQTAAPGVLSRWLPKAQPRLKGFSRKLVLRQVNRKIIARVARRFTIGIPVLGFYFVSKLMVKDLARVKSELAAGEYAVAALFSSALVADVLDLAAQMTVITGLAHANLGMGLAGAAALLVAADHASLATAAMSFSCGLGGELLALKRAGELAAGSSSE